MLGGYVGNPSSDPNPGPRTAFPSSTTLSGVLSSTARSYHVVRFTNASAQTRLDGFVISGGLADDAADFLGLENVGGGIYNLATGSGVLSSPTLTSLVITGSSAGRRDNITIPTLTGVLLSHNTASNYGGGMDIQSFAGVTGSPVLTNVTITQNIAQSGGGISCYAFTNLWGFGTVSPRLTGVLLSQTTATAHGGGLYNRADNTQGLGIGISNPVLTNVAFANNRAKAAGGAIYNTVIFGNTGGGAFGSTGITVGFSLLENSISSLSYTSGGNNLTTTRAPFIDGANGNLRLNVCAQAINTGSNAANTTSLDLDGLTRIVFTTIDMGAYEFGGTLNVFTGITQQPPSSSAICAGSTVSIPLSVSGTEPLSAQLYRDGQPVESSQSSLTFTLSNVTSSSAGNYSVVVTDACNSVTSTVFSLTVNPSPMVTISPNPTLTIGTGQSATLTASGGAGLPANAYNWSNLASTTAISVSVAGTYSVTGTTNGCSGTASVVLSVTSAAPIITTQPATASTVCEGASVMTSVVVSNSVTGYQWLKGPAGAGQAPQPVAGQTGAMLSLGNVQVSDAGVYSLSVTGPGGLTTSNGFTLTVNPLPTVTIIFPNSVTVAGSPVPVVRVPSLNPPVVFQAFGGVNYERLIILDRINGFEIRQVDSNATGIFSINRLGLFTLTVTGAAGCKRTVQWVVQPQ